MENYFSNINLVRTLLKWKWHLIIVVIIAAILAAIFSGPAFIKPKFKSSAVLYPSNIAPYSDESETEQMLQWLNAKDIKDSVIDRFDLGAHYKIGKDYKYYYSTILYKYGKNISIKKTQYESIEIEAMDTDPAIARDIVNSIMEFLNKKIWRIHKEKYDEVVAIYQDILNMKQHEMDSIAVELKDLRTDYGIIDYGYQSWEVSRGFLGTVDGDNTSRNINRKEVSRLKENIEKYGGDYIIYQTRLYDNLRVYAEFQEDFERAYYDANKKFTYTNIVSEPFAADKKSYPVRWLILFYSVAASFILALVVIFILENRSLQGFDKKDSQA